MGKIILLRKLIYAINEGAYRVGYWNAIPRALTNETTPVSVCSLFIFFIDWFEHRLATDMAMSVNSFESILTRIAWYPRQNTCVEMWQLTRILMTVWNVSFMLGIFSQWGIFIP